MKLRIYLTGLAFIGLIFLNIAYSQPAPTGCMPANNSAEFTTYVSFSWDYSTDSDVEGYELIITCNGNTQSYFPEDPWVDNVELDAGTTISWSVAATIQGVAGPSSSQSFIIPSEPFSPSRTTSACPSIYSFPTSPSASIQPRPTRLNSSSLSSIWPPPPAPIWNAALASIPFTASEFCLSLISTARMPPPARLIPRSCGHSSRRCTTWARRRSR